MPVQAIIDFLSIRNVLFIFSVVGVLALIVVTLFALFYQKIIYNKILIRKFSDSYNPFCSIILPCKGLPKNFRENIESFLNLDYENYRVIYTVESEDDPALSVIKDVAGRSDKADFVVAGNSTKCSQKNYNMLKALAKCSDSEMYVFADSDIKLYPSWLKELVRPLSNSNISVVSGFRWLYSANGRIGELANVYQNVIIYVLFSFASFFQNVGLWGGSMAIRKKDFDNIGVADMWGRTVVDDMSLSALVMKKRRKAVMAVPCIVPTDDALPTIISSVKWFERQMMFLKAYQKPQWVLAVLLAIAISLSWIWLPISLIYSLVTNSDIYSLGGISSLIIVIGPLLTMFVYPSFGKYPYFIKSIVLYPISLFSVVLGIIKTVFTNTVVWSGITYKLNGKGEVTSVER